MEYMKPDDLIFDLGPFEKRIEGIQDWLEKNGRGCFEEQEQVHAGTKGKIYWHYGYMCALIDALNFLRGADPANAHSDSPPSDKCN